MYINEEGASAATSTADMAQVTLPLGGTQKRKLALDGSGPIAKKKKKLKRFKEFIKEQQNGQNNQSETDEDYREECP